MFQVGASSRDQASALARTEPELRLREAILEQTGRVRKLKVKPEIEEATRELVSLKEEYKTVTGSEWSDLREEGPILLTTNKVRGREVLPELKEMVKQLRRENVIRLVSISRLVYNKLLIFQFQDYRHHPDNHRDPRHRGRSIRTDRHGPT